MNLGNDVGNDVINGRDKQSPEPDKVNVMAEVWDWIKSIALALIIVFIIHQFVFNLSKVDGFSMQPTLQHGERLFVNKIVYLLKEPKHSDIVILKDPRRDKKQRLVKRVIAVPGDTVEIREHRLYVNGEQVDEPYTATRIQGAGFGPLLVEEGQYFVLGDNRHLGESLDSRDFGAIDRKLIEGRADFIVWPITHLDKL